jgi:hypothetical protein
LRKYIINFNNKLATNIQQFCFSSYFLKAFINKADPIKNNNSSLQAYKPQTPDSDQNQYYSTVNSQKSLLSVESQPAAFPNGQIEFSDGLQRLRRVNYSIFIIMNFI